MKKYKQALLTLCLALAFLFLTACGAKEDVKDTTNAAGTASETESSAAEPLDGTEPSARDESMRETGRDGESGGALKDAAKDLESGARDAADQMEEGMTEAKDRLESAAQ